MLERGLWTMVAKAPGKSPSIPERWTISETEADAWTRDDRCQALRTWTEILAGFSLGAQAGRLRSQDTSDKSTMAST
jgi:hypothetical protein